MSIFDRKVFQSDVVLNHRYDLVNTFETVVVRSIQAFEGARTRCEMITRDRLDNEAARRIPAIHLFCQFP